VLLERRPSAVPGYNGCLLRLAVDLADRLLPAFDTASGVPLSWVHLQKVSGVATIQAWALVILSEALTEQCVD